MNERQKVSPFPTVHVRALGIALALVGLLWIYKVLIERRPFWVTAGDGELVFYFSSLAILTGHRPLNVSHPGTPLHFLGAAIGKVLHAGPTTVVIEPFLLVGYVIGLLATAAALAGLASITSKKIPAWAAAAVLLSYFTHPSALFFLTQWVSYMFHLPLGLLGLWCLWRCLRRIRQPNPIQIIAAGFVVGLACSVQMVFLPIIAAGVVAFSIGFWAARSVKPKPAASPPRFRMVILSIAWLLLSVFSLLFYLKFQWSGTLVWSSKLLLKVLWMFLWFNVGAAGVDLLFSIFGRFQGARWHQTAFNANWKYLSGAAFGWLSGTFLILDRFFNRYSSGGLYNTSDGILRLPWHSMEQNLAALAQQVPLWSILFVLTTAALLLAIVRTVRRRKEIGDSFPETLAMGIAVLICQMAGLLLSLQQGQFYGPPAVSVVFRYTLPVVVTVTFGLAWLSNFYNLDPRSPFSRRAAAVFSVLIFIAFGYEVVRDVSFHHQDIQAGYAEKRAVDVRMEEFSRAEGREPVVLIGHLRRPSWALRWGSANADYLFDADLDRVYPNEREFDCHNENGIVPRGTQKADLIFIRESEMKVFWLFFGKDQFDGWLKKLGPAEELTQGLQDPIRVIRVERSVPLR